MMEASITVGEKPAVNLSANRNAIKVFVCADAGDELAKLEETCGSRPSLVLVGSNLGMAGLDDEIALTEPDVLLAHVVLTRRQTNTGRKPASRS